MNQKQFLETVLASGGIYCLFDGARRSNNFHLTLDELLTQANKLAGGSNLFFALSTYNSESDRKGTNTKEMKSFFLDIDSKDVGSKRIAVERAQMLCKIYKLPKPIVVDSGNGMHFYWPLEHAIDTQKEWKPVAEHFKKLCATDGVGADTNVTADSARVLRIPETYNLKDPSNPKKVKIISGSTDLISYDRFKELIGYTDTPSILDASKVSGLFDSVNDNLAGNYKSCFADVVKEGGCNFLRKAMEHNDTLSEPEWYSSLSIAQHCEDSDVYIIKLSEDHPDYSYETAVKKAQGAEYPHSCETLRANRPEWCEGCPHFNKIKSPIVLGNKLVEAAVEGDHVIVEPKRVQGKTKVIDNFKVPLPPAGFAIGKEGGIYKQERDEDGEVVLTKLTEYLFYGVDRMYDREIKEESLIVRLHLANDEPRTEILPNSVIASADKLRERLANIGLLSGHQKLLREYVMSWVTKFQREGTARAPIKQFGWVDDVTREEFVLGENIITKQGVDVALPSKQTSSFVPYFDKKGSFANWQAQAKVWEDPKFVQQQIGLGFGVGSILMGSGEVAGGILHMFSEESGLGKTAITRAVASMWGDPKALTVSYKDTGAARMNRFEVYHNLPVCIDEITNIDAAEASDLIYAASMGTQRRRMSGNSNAERPTGKPWSLLCLTTANSSLISRVNSQYGKANPEAEAQRVLEMRINRVFPKDEEPEEIRNCMSTFQNNYGHAGPMVVEYIINNPDAIAQTVKMVEKALMTKANLGPQNRYHKWMIISCMVGLSALKHSGVFVADITECFKYLIGSLLPFNKERIDAMDKSPEDYISEFLSERIGNVVIASDNKTAVAGTISQSVAEQKARVAIDARYESDSGLLYLRTGAFTDWCNSRQIDYQRVVKSLAKTHNAERKKSRISTGTSLNLNSVWCLVLAWNMNDVESVAPTGDPE